MMKLWGKSTNSKKSSSKAKSSNNPYCMSFISLTYTLFNKRVLISVPKQWHLQSSSNMLLPMNITRLWLKDIMFLLWRISTFVLMPKMLQLSSISFSTSPLFIMLCCLQTFWIMLLRPNFLFSRLLIRSQMILTYISK